MSISAVIIAYNELYFLKHTLHLYKQAFDRIIIVDMNSNDGSKELYESILDSDDLILEYSRNDLFRFGFSHARNYGAKHAKTDWIMAIDCDEIIDLNKFESLKNILNQTEELCFSVERKNYAYKEEYSLDNLDELLSHCPYQTESHRRIYKNLPNIEFKGMIHEEIFIGTENAFYHSTKMELSLNHLNQYKKDENAHLKFGLYSYLTLQGIIYPNMRYGTNEFWYTEFTKQNITAMVNAANDFASLNGLKSFELESLLKLI